MGCHPSKSELRHEIDHLRKQEAKHKRIIKKLKNKEDVNGETNYAASDSDSSSETDSASSAASAEYHERIKKLEQENEKLKEENDILRKGNAERTGNNFEMVAHNGANQVVAANPTSNIPHSKNLPKVGDAVLAMWSVSMWQYFTATIVMFDPESLTFEIIWDDQDPSGRIISYQNLALDRVPDDDEVAVGSIVLFPQGQYKGQEGVRLGGQRWHQGKITAVSKENDGTKYYSGEHTKGDADGKWVTFKGYDPEFQDLTIDQLRIAPNVLDLLSADTTSSTTTTNRPISTCDIFLSYCKLNSLEALENEEVEKPPSYDEAMAQSFCDPRKLKKQLSTDLNLAVSEYTGDLVQTVEKIQEAKVVIAFLSDEYAQDEICRQEFQYAKKTARKPVIPVVVGSSFEWMTSVVGLLIAGELYIHFKDQNVQSAKFKELQKAIRKNIPDKTSTNQVEGSVHRLPKGKADVFISYCWSNSNKALEANQIGNLIGNPFADARRIKDDLTTRNSNLTVWLDIERLETTNQSDETMSMFQQIATGINQAKVVIIFISEEYAKSDNCRAEFQFALTSLKKPVIPVIVGSGITWRNTVIGLLLSTLSDVESIDMQTITTDQEYEDSLCKIEKNISQHLSHFIPKSQQSQHVFSAPMVGDHVVCHHQKWAFFFATVQSFDGASLQYTVNWDDNDPTGREQSYKDLAVDAVPSPDQIGVDSVVFFPQGGYGATEGNNTGGKRFHQGVVTNIHKDLSGVTLYDGHHTKGEDDGKWITYKDYNYEFHSLTIQELRIAPNAMDALMACKQAFLLDD